MVLGYTCSIAGIVLAIISIWKRCFGYGTYASFMLIQAIGLYYTDWKILCVAGIITLIALLTGE